jgi:hypothetical protein
LRISSILRKSVIKANGAPDDEKPVCDLVYGARYMLAGFAVNDQFANLEWLLLAGFCEDFHGAPLSQGNGMGLGSSKAASGEQQRADEYE